MSRHTRAFGSESASPKKIVEHPYRKFSKITQFIATHYLTLIEAEDIPIALYPKGVPEDAQLTFKEFSTALYDTLMEFLASRGTGGKAERVLVRDSLKLLFIAMDSQEVAGVVAEAAQIVGRKK